MHDLQATSIKYQSNTLYVLDQHQLPHIESWLPCESVDAMVAMIQKLQIRGAPLIGIGASLLLGHLAANGTSAAKLQSSAEVLRAARPTAVNLMNNMDSMLAALHSSGPAALPAEAERLFHEDIALCDTLATLGAELITANANILTHCNTGSLATAGVGTAIGVINAAHQQGKNIHVYIDETRPLLQGGRLTAWEMKQLGVAHTLICDNMAALLMRDGKVDCILVGADRIAVNGDFANKVGTYSLAVNAHHHNVPFYVVAPYTTVDVECLNGEQIPIEERAAAEVRGVSSSFGDVCWSPTDTPVFNPAFDVTPAALVTGWILDKGVFNQEQINKGALKTL
ncbi:S-methyl-5-thioribose-1-phosphate isomerase [Neptunomonas qingdaonensis]|uniref:Methylthioribose-1-phosphate isomerase n=1 Tax=Neptunomonas qingdaonensis TaxID=1045558 RepID=A0A1I2P6U0_9GAMM|nr:S-methyl-5-thioribose-1-phosphate isomerase [Neptunomonas qingdaonensis]SFG11233.1 methylthioribose-1-phosphate isomerase [Neptunomonas qingdaonensis]